MGAKLIGNPFTEFKFYCVVDDRAHQCDIVQ